jgi:hypothetical protein
LKGNALLIDRFFPQDGKDFDHVPHYLLGERRGTRFFLVKEEEEILFPKYSKGGEVK